MNADLIKKLRATTYLADPYAVMAKAATALEASDKREADLIAKIAEYRRGDQGMMMKIDLMAREIKALREALKGRAK